MDSISDSHDTADKDATVAGEVSGGEAQSGGRSFNECAAAAASTGSAAPDAGAKPADEDLENRRSSAFADAGHDFCDSVAVGNVGSNPVEGRPENRRSSPSISVSHDFDDFKARPSPSATSITLTSNNTIRNGNGYIGKEGEGETNNINDRISVADVADGGGRGGKSDGRGLKSGGREVKSDGRRTDFKSASRQTLLPTLIVKGVLRVGRMYSDRSTFSALENADLQDVLGAQQDRDTVIEAAPGCELTVVDVDSHHWKISPSQPELLATLASIAPVPDAAWISHGNGLKLLYIGPAHRPRAIAAAYTVPPSFTVELKVETRHPLSARSDKPGARCGDVHFGAVAPPEHFVFKAIGALTPELRQEALDRLGVQIGERLDHDRCPIDPRGDTPARGCVVVLEAGVYCHRCASHGIRFRSQLSPGFLPFGSVVGNDQTILDRLARNFVHWVHAKIELKHWHQHLGDQALQESYRYALMGHHGDGDIRIPGVFNSHLGFVRGTDLWLAVDTYKTTVVDNDAAGGMPYCQYIGRDEKGRQIIKVDPVRRAEVKHRAPDGYFSLRPYRGIDFSRDLTSIPVLAPPTPAHPVKLLEDPLNEDEAFGLLAAAFPNLDQTYLKACMAAAICASAGSGQPPMVVATGPSGSGKGETIRLAASFMGDTVVKVQLDDNPEAFVRNVGMLLASGHRYICFDEFGKIPNLSKKVGAILQLGAVVEWRPLFQNQRVQSPCRAAFFFPCVRFPDFLTSSAEFLRRTRHIHLFHRTPKWDATSGGDTAEWRDRSEKNAHIANSLLTHTWRLCHDQDFRFF